MKKPIPFGKYLLLDRVNVGGMAEVFKAKAFGVEGFERLVAVKRILPSIAEDIEFITMFIDEAKIAVQLTHANIAQIFDLGKVNDSYFIALEYVQGKDLRAIFERARKRGEPLPVPLACYVIMKVCEGLDYAHNKKDSAGREFHLVHRDVSPQNILLSYDGEVKIIDFGIAKAAGKAGKTQAGILKGKFGYMSPEQVRGLPLDRRSDIFAVGICLYELLTGERLFVGESDFSTLEKVRNVEIMPPSTYNRRIPEELEQIVLKSLSRDFDDRYQTAMDLHDDLQSFMYTSGNFFARKDLGTYMKKTFAEEIAKESMRDEELATITAQGSGLDAFNDIPSSSSGEMVQPRATMKPPSRRSDSPGSGSNPGGRVSKVPAPPPPPPRMAAASVAPAPSSATVDMEWDDEELSTQIYDRPDAAVAAAAAVAAGLTGSSPQAPTLDQMLTAQMKTQPGEPKRSSNPPPLPRSSNPPQLPAPAFSPPPAVAPSAVASRMTPVAPKPRKKSQAPIIYAAAGVLAILAVILVWLAIWGGKDPAKITLTTSPADVTVLFDAAPVLSTSSPFVIADITADEHHLIEVQKAGYDPYSQMITLRPGEQQTLNVTLMPARGANGRPTVIAAAGQSGFTLDTQPSGATVTVDGRQLAQRTPVRVTDLAPGEHQIRVSAGSQYDSTQLQVETTAGQIVALPIAVLPLRSVLVDFQSAPSGATVSIIRGSERRILGSTPTRAEVDTTGGSWTIEMVKEGFALATQPLTLPEGQPTYRVTVPLTAAAPGTTPVVRPPTPPPSRNNPPRNNPPRTQPQQNTTPVRPPDPPAATGTGTLRINTRPWTQVFVDGQLVGNTPQMNLSLRAGSHRVTLVNAEFNIREALNIEIAAGQTVTRVLTLQPGTP